jgi:hypothetical protein
VDMMSIDEEYKLMVERAIEEFKQEKAWVKKKKIFQ